MRRRAEQHEEAADNDSFLDIVANIVGILIILVVVVTARAQQIPTVSIPSVSPRAQEIETAHRESESLRESVYALDAASKQIDQELQAARDSRNYMATLVAAAESQMEEQREELNGREQIEYDLRNELATSKTQLERVSKLLALALDAPKNVVQLKNYPTPLSKTVYGKEVHFRLLGRRIAFVPIDELVEELKGHSRAGVWKLDDQLTEATDMVGPIDGFRMRYTMERVEIPIEQRIETGRVGHVVRLKKFELLPIGSELGESVEEAMQPGSRFLTTLNSIDKERTTVTLWVYPDSFALFRDLKKTLFEHGFATAGRPLVPGVLIGGSPQGTRSSAE